MSNHSTPTTSLNAKVEAMLRRYEAAHEMLQESADQILFLIAVLRRGDNIALDRHGANGLAAILESVHNQISNAMFDAGPGPLDWKGAFERAGVKLDKE